MSRNTVPTKRTRGEYEIEEEEQRSPYHQFSKYYHSQSTFGVQQGGAVEDAGLNSVLSNNYY